MHGKSRIEVALSGCAAYDAPNMPELIGRLFEAINCRPTPGTRVLVKPNLLAPAAPGHLPCTHPLVVRAICLYLLDQGAKVRVGDSPTFGQAVEISGKIGLTETLADLPVSVANLDRPKLARLSFGGRMAISRTALENDLIVNVPKLKAHHQMRVTGAVKNVYGCVPGLCKPLQHLLYGDRGCCFESMILEVWDNLPPAVSLMDAVIAMHIHGPTKGKPYPLGLLAASPSAVALDSAVMGILGLEPEDAPLWRFSLNHNLPGAVLEDLSYPLDTPDSFFGKEFKTPLHLLPLSFSPLRITRHYMKRLLPR